MLKNPLYQYGSTDLNIPANLSFSEFILNKLVQYKDRKIINGLTEETVSYGEIAQQAMNLAISLSRLGVRKGQTVAICSENRTEFWSAVVGSICTGAMFTTLNLMYTENELLHVTNTSKPNYIICSPIAYKLHAKTLESLNYIEKVIVFGEERPVGTVSFNDLVSAQNVKFEDFRAVDVEGDDVLFVLYSSGTTGLPKGVMLTHKNVLISSCSKIQEESFTVSLNVTPWFHAMGLMATFIYLSGGRNIVFLPKFEVEPYLRCIEKYKVIHLMVVPPMLVALMKHSGRHDVSSVELIFSGAAPLTKGLAEAAKIIFPNTKAVLQSYGMTEATLAITRIRDLNKSTVSRLGNVGKVVPGMIIKVVDLETQKPVGVNQRGEICVKGSQVMRGYVGKAREGFDDEGFFRTGDVGYYDEDGYFFIVDRLKELIKYKGYQVAPAEIEAVLLQHSAVQDVGVVGVPDAVAGEVPVAFVVLQSGATINPRDLQWFVAERLSNPKHLRGGVRFVTEIPKNSTGKVLRRQLRALAQGKSKL